MKELKHLADIFKNYDTFIIDLWGVMHNGVTLNPNAIEVVAVGPGAKNEDGKVSSMDVKVGDIVLFGKWSGTEVKIDGKEYSIMKESDIMGISKSKK